MDQVLKVNKNIFLFEIVEKLIKKSKHRNKLNLKKKSHVIAVKFHFKTINYEWNRKNIFEIEHKIKSKLLTHVTSWTEIIRNRIYGILYY